MRRGPAIALSLVGVALLGLFVFAALRPREKTKGKEVRTEQIATRRLESWVRAPGEVEPARLLQISSNVTGRVTELSVQEGDRARRGQVLLRLESDRYRSAAAQTRARLEAAQANLQVARANVALSKQVLQRKERLFGEGLIAEAEIEETRNQAAVDAARLEAAQEDVHSLRASLEEADQNLRETVFIAPIDGVVTLLNVEVGENVITGTMNNPGTVILSLAELDTMVVEAEVDETDVTSLAVGQSARVLLDALPDTSLVGTVESIGQSGRRSASGQSTAIYFPVRVRIDQEFSALRPGMSADVEILTGRKDDALSVPIQSLVAQPSAVVDRWRRERSESASSGRRRSRASGAQREDTLGVGKSDLVEGLFLDRDGEAHFVPVEFGLRGDVFVEVIGAVSVVDRVVTGPYKVLRDLRDGDRLQRERRASTRRDSGSSGS